MRSTRAFACAFLLTAAAAVPAIAADTAGFLYGRVTTEAGDTYQGRLRWDDEEAFWGDFFNSAKEDNEWVDLAPRDDREGRKRRIEVFGVEIGSVEKWEDFDHGRQFIARFGDIARIEPRHGDELVVTMKSGKKYELEGGSNDVEAKIRVWDGSLGVVELDWRRIRAIDLMETPALGAVPVRLHGTVKTRSGYFTGFVQWDQ